MFEDLKTSTRQKMQAAVNFVQEELASIRSGRANPAMLESIRAEVYGSTMTIKELGNINTPEPRQFLIQVWDGSNTASIARAIQTANLGLNPQVEGQMIRVNLPPLTEESRRQLAKVVTEKSEEGKIRIRQARHEANKELSVLKNSGKISEDIQATVEDEIQKIHDETMKNIEEMKEAKEKDLLTV